MARSHGLGFQGTSAQVLDGHFSLRWNGSCRDSSNAIRSFIACILRHCDTCRVKKGTRLLYFASLLVVPVARIDGIKARRRLRKNRGGFSLFAASCSARGIPMIDPQQCPTPNRSTLVSSTARILRGAEYVWTWTGRWLLLLAATLCAADFAWADCDHVFGNGFDAAALVSGSATLQTSDGATHTYFYRIPATPAPACGRAVLFWLHGDGGSGNGYGSGFYPYTDADGAILITPSGINQTWTHAAGDSDLRRPRFVRAGE